jgi:L-lactate dehydrogenase complex protein LldE
MTLAERESPKGKRVSLFVTCMVDMLFPQTGMSVVKVLEHLGIEVDFPMAQTCCGQPAFNAGYRHEARQVAEQFLRAFEQAQVIVTPSGSCAAMVRLEYPQLFAGDLAQSQLAERLASITWEFTEFLVVGLGVADLHARLPEPTRFAFHDSCHGLRLLGLGDAGRQLIEQIENASLVELPEHDVCCGFGGLFAVKMADVSGAMLAKKIENIANCPAQVVGIDMSCATHINAGLEKSGSTRRIRHVADVLAEALDGKGVS